MQLPVSADFHGINMEEIEGQNQVCLQSTRANIPENPIQVIPWGFKYWNGYYEYSYFITGLVKNKLSQLTFSFLKNPSLNLLVVNPLTPTERNRWYLA